jgi:hypothetical protein
VTHISESAFRCPVETWRILFATLVFALLLVFPVSARVDPESSRIRLLVIGECTRYDPYFVTLFPTDPKVELVTVITAGDRANPRETARYIRIYMPRTRERFLSEIDALELFDFVPWVLEDYHIQWFHDGLKDHALGMTLVEMGWYPSYMDTYTSNDPEAWMKTVLYQAYPVDLVVGKQNKPSSFLEVVQDTPVVGIPGFDEQNIGGVAGLTLARPGSLVHARYKVGKEAAIVSTEYGEGRSLTLPTGWDVMGFETQRNWKYFVDFVLNHVYFVANVPVPEDPELAHGVRSLLASYIEQKSLTVSFIDFIAKFGANTAPLEAMLGQLEREREDAEKLYLESEYEAAKDAIAAVMERFVEIESESVRIRRRALLWIYVTEWVAVTGTSMFAGFILWSLMVRRRLYREVTTTRLIEH